MPDIKALPELAQKPSYYMAGAFNQTKSIRDACENINEVSGWQCSSTWLVEHTCGTGASSVDIAKQAEQDIKDIERSQAVIIDLSYPTTTGGYFVELGYAIAVGKTVFVHDPVGVNHANNKLVCFAYMECVITLHTYREIAAALKMLAAIRWTVGETDA